MYVDFFDKKKKNMYVDFKIFPILITFRHRNMYYFPQ